MQLYRILTRNNINYEIGYRLISDPRLCECRHHVWRTTTKDSRYCQLSFRQFDVYLRFFFTKYSMDHIDGPLMERYMADIAEKKQGYLKILPIDCNTDD